MKDFTSERLEQLHLYMSSDIRDFEDIIYEIGLFDYDGICGKIMQSTMHLYAEELSERNQYAYAKVKDAFEMVREVEHKSSAILSEIKEQLKGYSEYVQGMGTVMRSGDCSSPLFAKKHISSLYKKVLLSMVTLSDELRGDLLGGMDSVALAGVGSTYSRPPLTEEDIQNLRESIAEFGVPEDFVADKLVILNQPEGAGGKAGHNALILIGEDGSGLFYSFGGTFGKETVSILMGNDSESHLDAVYLTKEKMREFFTDGGLISEVESENLYSNSQIDTNLDEKSETGKDGKGGDKEKAYENGTLIDISEEQGWLMISEAERIRNSTDEPYNLYYSNCGQKVSQITSAANIVYGNPSGDAIDERGDNIMANYNKYKLPIIPGLNGYNSIATIYNISLFSHYAFEGEIISAHFDGTIPNSTYIIEAEAGEEKGWISGTLSELYGEFSNE